MSERITFQPIYNAADAEIAGLIRVRLDGFVAGYLVQDDKDLLWCYTRQNDKSHAQTFELISDAKAFATAQIIERETDGI